MNISILYWLLVAHRRCIQGAGWIIIWCFRYWFDHWIMCVIYLAIRWELSPWIMLIWWLGACVVGIKKNMHGVSSKAQWIDVLLLDIHAGMIQKLWLCMHQDYNSLLVTLVLYTKLWPCKESISIWILKLKTHTAASFMGLIIFCYHVYSFLWTSFNRTR